MVETYRAIVRLRLPLVLLLTALLTVASFALLQQRPEVHRSVGLLEVTSGSLAESILGQSQGYQEPLRRLASETEVLQSRPVAERAVSLLADRGVVLGVDEASAALEVRPRGTSNYLEVAGEHPEARLAQGIAQAFVDAYFAYTAEVQRTELQALERELQAQRAAAAEELEELGDAPTLERSAVQARLDNAVRLLDQVRLRAAVPAGSVRVLSAPELPDEPEGRLRPDVALALCAFVSYFLALGLVVLVEAFRDAVRTVDEAEAMTGAVTLATVPVPRARGRTDVAAAGVQAAGRDLRVRLEGLGGGRLPGRVLVAGLPADGKEVALVGQALAEAAASAGAAPLLVSDARFTQVRAGAAAVAAPVERLAVHRDATGVAVCRAAGHDGATGLLDAGPVEEVLSGLETVFDTVIVPASGDADLRSTALAPFVPVVVVVVVLRRTRGRAVLRLAQELQRAGTDVSGTVLVVRQGRRDGRRGRTGAAVPPAPQQEGSGRATKRSRRRPRRDAGSPPVPASSAPSATAAPVAPGGVADPAPWGTADGRVPLRPADEPTAAPTGWPEVTGRA